jgi:hypothetical protein
LNQSLLSSLNLSLLCCRNCNCFEHEFHFAFLMSISDRGINCYVGNLCESSGVPGSLLLSETTAKLVDSWFPTAQLLNGPTLAVSGYVPLPSFFLVPPGADVDMAELAQAASASSGHH